MLTQNFSQTVTSFTAKDNAFHFMPIIKGTPAYCEKFLQEILAMVKQLGLPAFFMISRCGDLTNFNN